MSGQDKGIKNNEAILGSGFYLSRPYRLTPRTIHASPPLSLVEGRVNNITLIMSIDWKILGRDKSSRSAEGDKGISDEGKDKEKGNIARTSTTNSIKHIE